MLDKGRESVKVVARRGRQQFGLFSFFVDILVSRNTALERHEMEVTMLTHPHHCQSHSKGTTLTLDEPLFVNVLFQQLCLPRQRADNLGDAAMPGTGRKPVNVHRSVSQLPLFPSNESSEARRLRRH